jgi:nucleoside-diphosphate kinase
MPMEETWLFVVEWFDPQPMLKRQYVLKYFLESHMVEMVDVRTKKLFLKKSAAGGHISKQDFFIGGKLLVYGRELDIVDFGDGKTRSKLQVQQENCVVILPSALYKDWGTYLDKFNNMGMVLKRVRTLYLDEATESDVSSVLGVSTGGALTGSVSLMAVYGAERGIEKMGATCSALSADLGTAAAIVPSDTTQVDGLIKLLGRTKTTATLDSCTCCLIKPHAVKAGNFGQILDIIISQGYEVSAMETFSFDKAQSQEFLEVYKDVVPNYSDHVVQLCSGLSVVMELRAENAVVNFRATAGPWDVQMAKELRGDTLRAKFGEDNVRCAVHCTDLPTDGVTECEYCFTVMV